MKVGRWEGGKVGRSESRKVGKWESGKVGKWEGGKVGKWEGRRLRWGNRDDRKGAKGCREILATLQAAGRGFGLDPRLAPWALLCRPFRPGVGVMAGKRGVGLRLKGGDSRARPANPGGCRRPGRHVRAPDRRPSLVDAGVPAGMDRADLNIVDQ